MASVINFESQQLVDDLLDLSINDQSEKRRVAEIQGVGFGRHGGICAICLDKVVLQENALVKGCEHAYCVTCILHWATYNPKVTCPQCKHPFAFLNVHRSLDGSVHDYMFEESVCLLLRASWFKPLNVENYVKHHVDIYDDMEDYCDYEDVDDELEEVYCGGLSGLRIGNRRWGDNGYVRAGRQEARPVCRPNSQDSGASSYREPRKKEATAKAKTGRRAKRAMKREAADKAAAERHQQHLARLGRK